MHNNSPHASISYINLRKLHYYNTLVKLLHLTQLYYLFYVKKQLTNKTTTHFKEVAINAVRNDSVHR